MDTRKKNIIKFLVPTVVAALAASFLIKGYTDRYLILEKPPLAPPVWLFPVAWSILYVLIAISGALAYTASSQKTGRKIAVLYALQLAVNVWWPVAFFRFGNIMQAVYVIILLWVLIIMNIIAYSKTDRLAAVLFVPYFLWVTFAAYLNYSIYLLN